MEPVHHHHPRVGRGSGERVLLSGRRHEAAQVGEAEQAVGSGLAARRLALGVVNAVVEELCFMLGHREGAFAGQTRGRERRAAVHRRQIAMYVAHVVLRLSLTDIGIAYGRDRTTVGHACHVVEDRRDDAAYDRFVAGIERIVSSALELREVSHGH